LWCVPQHLEKDQYFWLQQTSDGVWESLKESPTLLAKFGGGSTDAGPDSRNYFEAVWNKEIKYSADVLARNAQLSRDEANRKSLEADLTRAWGNFGEIDAFTGAPRDNIPNLGDPIINAEDFFSLGVTLAAKTAVKGAIKLGAVLLPMVVRRGVVAGKTGANLSTNGVKLAKQLASEAQMAEKGLTIIGPGKLKEVHV
jgi:hypothetical protein